MPRVVLFLSSADFRPIQVWTMELIRIHQLRGDDVAVVVCGMGLDACHSAKLGARPDCCVRCMSRTYYAVRELGLSPTNVAEIPRDPADDRAPIPDFRDVDELKAFHYDGVNVGLGVASSLISGIRDHEFDPRRHRWLVEANLRSAMRVTSYFRRRFSSQRPDLVYTYNGRYAESRPLIELCAAEGIPLVTYENGGSDGRYQLYPNTMPHDPGILHEIIEATWDAESDARRREEVGHRWFRNRRNGIKQDSDPVYVKDQRRDLYPEGIDRRKRNIAIYSSSEDEFAAVGDLMAFRWYRDQNEAMTRVREIFAGRSDVHFYFRVHPNLARLDNAQNRGLAALEAPNITVIPAHSPVDTYALMQQCDRVVTFGSTTGVEATYWEKPSILFGRAIYERLDAVHVARDYEELTSLLNAEALPVKPRLGALKYGYWFLNGWGTEVSHFSELLDPEDPDRGLDSSGRAFERVRRTLIGLRYPLTHTPFYRQLLSVVGRRSRRAFVDAVPLSNGNRA